MKPFILPEFYLPHPARLNPNLAYAQDHSAAWAEGMGILSEPGPDGELVWTAERLERMQMPLLCAYTHPDCDAETLALVTDWYVWVFFFDDDFLAKFKNTRRHGEAARHLERLEGFMAEPGSPAPEPGNPAEAGLADCWARTLARTSPDWRRRMRLSTHNLMVESLWELDNIARDRIANPIEYVEMRRRVGGAPWSANLVEYACGAEIPERFTAQRPVRVLCDTFSDGVHLRNDLFSYEREVRVEGENANMVLVLEHFLHLPTQAAADLVNDIITSRLKQFEDTATVDLPQLFVDQAATPDEQLALARYTQALQDWQAGGHEWHLRSSRYMNSGMNPGPTGLGSGVARLAPGVRTQLKQHMPPPRTPGRLPVPDLLMPYRADLHPQVEASRADLPEWVAAMGMVDPVVGWTAESVRGADLAGAAGLMGHEDAVQDLILRSRFLAWGCYANDLLSRVYRAAPVAGREQLRRLPIFATADAPTPVTPLECGLADLWGSASARMGRARSRRMHAALRELLGAWEQVLDNETRRRIPDPVDYLDIRRITAGGPLLAALVGSDGAPVATGFGAMDLSDTSVIRQLENSVFDHLGLVNDLYSYQKEIQFDLEHHNLVYVTQSFLGCSREAARDIVADLADERVRQFDHLVREDLPVFCEDYRLSDGARSALDDYVRRLQHLMAGDLAWYPTSERFDEQALWKSRRAPVPGGSSGRFASELADVRTRLSRSVASS